MEWLRSASLFGTLTHDYEELQQEYDDDDEEGEEVLEEGEEGEAEEAEEEGKEGEEGGGEEEEEEAKPRIQLGTRTSVMEGLARSCQTGYVDPVEPDAQWDMLLG